MNGKPAKGAAVVLFVRGSTPGSMVFGGSCFRGVCVFFLFVVVVGSNPVQCAS